MTQKVININLNLRQQNRFVTNQVKRVPRIWNPLDAVGGKTTIAMLIHPGTSISSMQHTYWITEQTVLHPWLRHIQCAWYLWNALLLILGKDCRHLFSQISRDHGNVHLCSRTAYLKLSWAAVLRVPDLGQIYYVPCTKPNASTARCPALQPISGTQITCSEHASEDGSSSLASHVPSQTRRF